MNQSRPAEVDDPVLLMIGVGKQLWEQESGDDFVDRLRAEDTAPPEATAQLRSTAAEDLPETVWRRIEKHQGQQFHTVTGLPFTFSVEGSGIWFFREGKRVNRKLSRGQVEAGISRCPLRTTTEIKDLIDYPYLFSVLMDRRIRGEAW